LLGRTRAVSRTFRRGAFGKAGRTRTVVHARSDGRLIREAVRRRSKAHLAFVASQPCVICEASPCDAHHLKIAQPRSLGRKVSDEFTVPLCRTHHQELHRNGNEANWWANMQVVPLPIAKELWETSPVHEGSKLLAVKHLPPTKVHDRH
jgi:hypothetical protein